MKIALIQCPVWGTYDPPLALAQLTSCLRKAGHEVFALDLNIKLYRSRRDNYKNMWAWEQSSFWYDQANVDNFFDNTRDITDTYLDLIVNSGACVCGFSVNAASRISSLRIAAALKRKKKGMRIVFGGPLFFEKRNIEQILSEGTADFVISGEAEFVLADLLRAIERGRDINSCEGIYFKGEKGIVKTNDAPPIANLDELPFMDFGDLALCDYDDQRHIPFQASRGCIQRCVFCSSRSFWQGFRAMSGERIFREIEFHKRNFEKENPDFGHIDFIDLMFNGNMNYLREFCDLMIKSRLGLFWTANMIIRPEMDLAIIRKMKESGCEHILFGIESGSQRVLGLMRKNYRIEDADRIIRQMHETGIKVTANFMFGFPGETDDDFKGTLGFIRRNAPYLSRVYPSRTYCAIEEYSYLAGHTHEFGIKEGFPNHLYWESTDGKNTYPERLKRCEEFCSAASLLNIEVGSGVQTSVELDRWFNLGHYYESKKDLKKALECFNNYHSLDKNNEVISTKIRLYTEEKHMAENTIAPEDKAAKPLEHRFTWNIHYACNYRCPYCFFDGKWAEYRKRNVYRSVNEWLKIWQKVFDNYGRCYMLITGGEPFMYPDFIELIEKISKIHFPINISTNASGDLNAFTARIDPEKVSLSVSFQPYFDTIDPFLKKVNFLRQRGFEGCINFVAYPAYMNDIEYYKERFRAIKQELKVIPFWGKYHDKEYPHSYTPAERAMLGINEEWFNHVRKKDSLCPAGHNSALIFPDGLVARCGQIGERQPLGNFFDLDFKLLDKPMPCGAEFCPCSENKLFGE